MCQSAQTLFAIIRDPEHHLEVLDISGNNLSAEHFEMMRLSIVNNQVLTSLDMRNNPGFEECKLLELILGIWLDI